MSRRRNWGPASRSERWTPERRTEARERAFWAWHTLEPAELHRRIVVAMDRSPEAAVEGQIAYRHALRRELEEVAALCMSPSDASLNTP